MRRRVAVPFLAVLALATACTGSSGKPRTLPSITPSASASPTPIAIPSEATARTPQGAEAYIRFFYQELNRAFAASDPEIIRALSNDECAACETYARSLEAAAKDGQFIRGDSFAVSDVAVPPLQAIGTIAEVVGTTPPRQVVSASGKVLEDLKSDGAFHVQVAVKWLDNRWLVSGIRIAK